MNDELRALLMASISSIFPVLQIVGLDLTGDQVATIMAFIGYTLTLIFYLVKNGQQPAQQPVVRVSIPDQEQMFEHPDPKGGTCVSWIPEVWDGSPTKCHCGALELVGR